jgi:hypothetical protein
MTTRGWCTFRYWREKKKIGKSAVLPSNLIIQKNTPSKTRYSPHEDLSVTCGVKQACLFWCTPFHFPCDGNRNHTNRSLLSCGVNKDDVRSNTIKYNQETIEVETYSMPYTLDL